MSLEGIATSTALYFFSASMQLSIILEETNGLTASCIRTLHSESLIEFMPLYELSFLVAPPCTTFNNLVHFDCLARVSAFFK